MSDIRNTPSEQEIEIIRAKYMPKAYWAAAYVFFAIYLGGRADYRGMPSLMYLILKNPFFQLIFLAFGGLLAVAVWIGLNLYVNHKCTSRIINIFFPPFDFLRDLKYAKPVLYGLATIIILELIFLIYRSIS